MRDIFAYIPTRIFLLLAATLPAGAADDAPYVGVWALEVRNCGVEQASPDAPMLVAKDRYDQHETHCSFKSVAANDADYKVSAECTVEGDTQTADFMLTVSGDTLTFTDETSARDFLRCH
jgi:hypothetical protein